MWSGEKQFDEQILNVFSVGLPACMRAQCQKDIKGDN